METTTIRALPELLSFVVDNRGRTCPVAEFGTPLIATNCLKRGQRTPVFENVRYVDDDTHKRWFRAHPEPGDVVFVCKGSPGRVAVVPDPVSFCIAQDMVALRAKAGLVDPSYLYYRLLSPDVQTRIEGLHVGTMIPHFKKGDFGKLKFTVHDDLGVQRAIGEVLGALDDQIGVNVKLDGTTDELLSAVFENAIGSADEGTGRLGAIAEVNTAVVRPRPGEGLRYVDIASVGVGSFDYPAISSWDDAPSRARRRIRRGDTLWSTVRPNRRSHALNLSDDPTLVGSTGLAVLTPRTTGFAYLFEVSRRPEFTAYLESVSTGSAYPAVRAEEFLEAPVPLLAADALAEFERVAQPLREAGHARAQANRLLAATRDALLPELISGRLRVKDAEQAVGEVA